MRVYIFEIAEIFQGISVAVVLAHSEDDAFKLLAADQAYTSEQYVWRLIDSKPLEPSVIVRTYE